MLETGVLRRPEVTARGGIAIGIASSGKRGVPAEWAIRMATQVYPPYTNTGWYHVIGKSIDDARNLIVECALKSNFKYLWFIDDDTVPPQDAARKLIYELDQYGPPYGKVMAAGGVYCAKQDPPIPLVFNGETGMGPFWDWKVGEVFTCTGIGTGCLMINIDIFREMPGPWFKTTAEIGFTETDDIYFCNRLRSMGYEIICHGGVLCAHHDMSTGEAFVLPPDSVPFLPQPSKSDNLVTVG